MSDKELDELILARLRNRREHPARTEVTVATQSLADLARSFNEPEGRVEARLQSLMREGQVKESTGAPDRWRLA